MMKQSGDYVPRDYDDLYSTYFNNGRGNSLARVLVRRFTHGLDEPTRDDLLQDVFVRMLELDALSFHNPDFGNFGAVLFFVSRSVCLNFMKRRRLDPLTALKTASLVESSPEMDSGVGESGLYVLDRENPRDKHCQRRLCGNCVRGVCLLRALDAVERVQRLDKIIEKCTTVNQETRARLSVTMAGLLSQDYSYKECAVNLGISLSSVYNYVKFLREELSGVHKEKPKGVYYG